MSLELTNETTPYGLRVKTYGGMDGGKVHIGTYELSLVDFLSMALYVLGNTDLAPQDPRLEFVDIVKSMEKVPGWDRRANTLRLQPKS